MRPRAASPILSGPCWLAFGIAVFHAHSAYATAVLGAQLTVVRTPAAGSCPTEAAIADELRTRASARTDSSEPLQLAVRLDAQGSAFTAEIRVSGRKQGERSLRAEGPTCDALRDVLVVSLSLLLDDDSDEVSPAPKPRARRVAVSSAGSAEGWLQAGGAATHGLPVAWSSAWGADFALRFPSWEVGLGGLWAPERTMAFSPGEIAIGTLGARARGCYAFAGRELRISGCAFAVLATLRGQAEHFSENQSSRRTWFLLGAGPELRWFPVRSLSLGISGQLLAAPARESFSIAGLAGSGYRTDRAVAWLGADVGVRIW